MSQTLELRAHALIRATLTKNPIWDIIKEHKLIPSHSLDRDCKMTAM